MAVIKNFKDFNNKDDIFELIDRFEKSSLFELDITIANNKITSDSEIRIKMMKTASGRKDDWVTSDDDNGEAYDDFDDGHKEMIMKMSKSKDGSGSESKSHTGDKAITAPLVGTFYSSPSPDSEAYVKVGDKITKGMIICIIEAMKTMNEIECETDGEIAEILAKNGSPVEYGQPLFRLK